MVRTKSFSLFYYFYIYDYISVGGLSVSCVITLISIYKPLSLVIDF